MTTGTVRRRYDLLASFYDQVTLDRLVYGEARRHAVELLALRPGDTVLDVGCGTGLSLSLLRDAVGPNGTVVGVDLSPMMLARARARVAAHGWGNVHLLARDVTELRSEDLPVASAAPRAALFALSLSTIPRPQKVLSAVAGLLAPDGRVAVLDVGVPAAPGKLHRVARLLEPVWRGVCRLAAADPEAHPWTGVPRVAPVDAVLVDHHLGFVRVAAGTVAVDQRGRSD